MPIPPPPPDVVYYRLDGAVPGTLMGAGMHVSYDPETGESRCHALITPEMFHAALASGAVQLSPVGADGSIADAPPLAPRPEYPGLRLVREA